MKTDKALITTAVFHSLNIAVLRRVSPGKYVIFGKPPPFYNRLFPMTGSEPCLEPWLHSPMLEFFIEDAERFFEKEESGALSSGIWQEDDEADGGCALLAIAVQFGAEKVVIVRMLEEEFTERVNILRKAREQLLMSRELTVNLEAFKKKARYDGLTKIYNRATFMELLHDETKRSLSLDYPLSMLFLDVDDFKAINDTYGHLKGDLVLSSLGTLLTEMLRRTDIIARYGGEEFVILLPHDAVDKACLIAEKVRLRIAGLSLPDLPMFTVSIGCTAYRHGETAEEFIGRTDEALYDAKKNGKNRVCLR